MATYIENPLSYLTLVVGISVVSFGLFLNFSSSSASVLNAQTDTSLNSQRIEVLRASNFSVEIPTATGGPNDPLNNKLAYLVPHQDIFSEEQASLQSIRLDPSGIIVYQIQSGDTLSEIAERFDVSINTIKWENNLTSNNLVPGKELRILPVTGVRHTVVKGDTFAKIASLYGVDAEDITVFNDIDATKLTPGKKIIVPNGVKKTVSPSSKNTTTTTATGTTSSSTSVSNAGYYIKPANGSVTSLFGPRWGRYHYGVDYGGNIGAPIYATADGVVSKVGCGSGYGICLIVQHSNGTESLYAHASALHVGLGATVKQGQKIASIGATGNVTGPHLHFEVRDSRTGQKKNMNYLK